MSVGGGKAIEFFPHTFLSMRPRNTSSINKFLTEQCGLSQSSYVVEVTTLKCKTVANNITAPIVFEPAAGFLELPTRMYNMHEDKVFSGATKKSLPNYKDFKFWEKEIPKLYETNEEFRAKFDECWNAYLDLKYPITQKVFRSGEGMALDNVNDLVPEEYSEEIYDENNQTSQEIDFSSMNEDKPEEE